MCLHKPLSSMGKDSSFIPLADCIYPVIKICEKLAKMHQFDPSFSIDKIGHDGFSKNFFSSAPGFGRVEWQTEQYYIILDDFQI